MQIVQSSSKSHANTASPSLNVLWEEVQLKRRRNKELQTELEALLRVYNEKLLPVQREKLLPVNTRLAKRLVELFSRKSLSHWHRDEMAEWIHELLRQIGQHDADKMGELSQRYNTVVAELQGMTLEEFEEHQADYEMDDFLDQFFADFDDELEHDEEDDKQDDMFGFADLEDRLDDEGDLADSAHIDEDWIEFDFGQEPAEEPLPAVDSKWLNSLFRRAARALHPDREQDPDKRADKQKLMAALLEARDKQDILTLVGLYSEHVEAGDLNIPDEDVHSIEAILKRQIAELDDEYLFYPDTSPLHRFVYDELYAKTPKARKKKLRQCIKNIELNADAADEVTGYMRNLSRLKEVLSQRIDHKRDLLFAQLSELKEDAVPF